VLFACVLCTRSCGNAVMGASLGQPDDRRERTTSTTRSQRPSVPSLVDCNNLGGQRAKFNGYAVTFTSASRAPFPPPPREHAPGKTSVRSGAAD
jgi:hypothetical protein